MKSMRMGVLCALCLVVSFEAVAQTQPLVTGVTASQAPYPSKDVNISFTLSDPVSAADNVWVIVSSDSGSTWTVPATNFSGAYGTNVPVSSTPAAKGIVWHAGTDWNGNYNTRCRARVIACNNGMCLIPAGSYARGSLPAYLPVNTISNFNSSSSDFNGSGTNVNGSGTNVDQDITDAPAYPVYVNAFLIENNDVNGYLWNNVVGYALTNGYGFDHASQPANILPVTGVNWYDAVKWCNARSQMEGVPPAYYTDSGFTMLYTNGDVDTVFIAFSHITHNIENGYRLPTEAEWEKAARGGLTNRFPWGDLISEAQANYESAFTNAYDLGPEGCNPTWSCAASPVGSFPPNGYNLYDMAGNVFDWCFDWYSSSYYASGQTNPQGPASGSNRVLRGGSWSSDSSYARCAYRYPYSPSSAYNNFGFRCVRGF